MLPHVVIIGGGFGGLYAARALRRARVRITLLDRRNHHVFQPLLYQVAMAALSPGDIASPIRWILRRQQNVEVLLADVRRDRSRAQSTIVLADGEIDLRLPDRRRRARRTRISAMTSGGARRPG